MFDRFSERARKVMSFAHQESVRLKHGKIDTEHILFGLIQEGSGVAVNVIENLDVDVNRLREALNNRMPPSGTDAGGPSLPITPAGKKVLGLAISEAQAMSYNYVGTEHLLLGLLGEADGLARQILTDAGLDLELTRHEVHEFLGVSTSGEQKALAEHFKSADRVLQMAGNEASRCSSALIEPEHLLAGLIVFFDYEKRWDIDFDAVLRALDKYLLPKSKSENLPDLKNSADSNEVLRLALKNAVSLGRNLVDVEHLLLGLLEFGRGPAFDALAQHGVTFDSFREKIRPTA